MQGWRYRQPNETARLPAVERLRARVEGSARLAFLLVFSFILAICAEAQGTAVPAEAPKPIAPFYRTFTNGLDVVALSIPSADRVSLSLVFRGGAEGQSAKTAGWLRLSERVLFRGTASSPGEPEPAGAIDALSPLSIGGGTSQDRFDVYFSVAPEMLDQGLDTLAYLFSELRRETAFSDPIALGEAKTAALAEIVGEASDPKLAYESALAKKLFSAAPWRLDPAGSPSLIQSATAMDLEALAAAWFVPNNAVIILAGAFNPEAALDACDSAFSSWRKSADPWKTPPAALAKPGVLRPTLLVYPDPSLPMGEAFVEMRYRGPDSLQARCAQAELWAEMAVSPGSRLLKALSSGMPAWSSASSYSAEYRPSRYASWFSISTKIGLSAKGNPADAAMVFKEIVRGSEMYLLKSNSSYFGAKDLEAGKASLRQKRDEALSNPDKAVLYLADGWIKGGFPWLSSWDEKLGAVSGKDLSSFADEYFMKNLEIIALRLSPEEYTARKKKIEGYGFTSISPTKAFWWQ